jgi:hypothetical protein
MLDGQANPNSHECEQCRSIVSFGAPVVVTAKEVKLPATMKLCPLFESIQFTGSASAHDEAMFVAGLYEAQKVLPRDAIEAAIVALEDAASCIRSVVEREHYDGCIEQLRALL